ncbi:MAG: Gfo/Idh/MocA family oxidoreductase [Pirellulales bacterium]|nr:Gfo/Idh/MocA family oxidoreductase [Pirellulales bacterium]
MTQKNQDRRSFLKTATAAAGATFAVGQTVLAEEAKGANGRPGVGFIGTGGRCGAHINIVNTLKKQGLVEPVAVCDVYGPRLRAASQKTDNAKMYKAHEELLQDPKVDIVCIATPDRHHAPQAIDAVRAGKDVYCEKPLTHWSQFDLAKKLGEETAKHKRIVQVGTQYMADDNYAKVRKMIGEGIIGKPVHVELGYYRRGDWGERMHIPDPNAKPGPDLNWERFLGDAPKVPYSVSRFFQWRLYWDYAGGPATDLLVHMFTPVFCLLGLDFPHRVLGGGGTFQYNREVPDQCNIIADYPDGPSVVMMNTLSNHVPTDTKIRGTDGVIMWKSLGSKDCKGIRIVPFGKDKKELFLPWAGMGSTTRLWANLIDCVKTRKQPYSPISAAVRVQAPLSMAIIGHRENKVTMFDEKTQSVKMV